MSPKSTPASINFMTHCALSTSSLVRFLDVILNNLIFLSLEQSLFLFSFLFLQIFLQLSKQNTYDIRTLEMVASNSSGVIMADKLKKTFFYVCVALLNFTDF